RVEDASTTPGLPVSPSLGPTLEQARLHTPAEAGAALVDRRVVLISALAILVAFAAAVIAQILMHLIWLITNISFHGRFSVAYGTPPLTRAEFHWWMVGVPVIGGIIVGF